MMQCSFHIGELRLRWVIHLSFFCLLSWINTFCSMLLAFFILTYVPLPSQELRIGWLKLQLLDIEGVREISWLYFSLEVGVDRLAYLVQRTRRNASLSVSKVAILRSLLVSLSSHTQGHCMPFSSSSDSSIKARWNKALPFLLFPVQTVQFCFHVFLYFSVWRWQTTIPYLCIRMWNFTFAEDS